MKAAKTSSAQRGVAVDAYGVVTNQAVKNLHYVQPRAALVEKLGQPSVARPATWTEGKLADSRADILDVVKSRRASDETRIVIVQPHLRSDLYDTLKNHPDPGRRTADTARLSLLEYVLNSARRTAVGLNADLTVISANI